MHAEVRRMLGQHMDVALRRESGRLPRLSGQIQHQGSAGRRRAQCCRQFGNQHVRDHAGEPRPRADLVVLGGVVGVDIPTAGQRRALAQTRRVSAELRGDEQRHRLAPGREPDEGFVTAVYRWATTGDLATALAASDVSGSGSPLSAGDFVRWCRQVLDLLDQVRIAAPAPALRSTAKRAVNDVRRGVVAVDAG